LLRLWQRWFSSSYSQWHWYQWSSIHWLSRGQRWNYHTSVCLLHCMLCWLP
jgi:hypothetical protein